MWLLMTALAQACEPEPGVSLNLIVCTKEWDDELYARDVPAARSVLEKVQKADELLTNVVGYADPSRLAALYMTGARAAAIAGDTAERDRFLHSLYVLSPEEPLSDELRRELGFEGDAPALAPPPKATWGKVRARGSLRVDGVPLTPGGSWPVPPGRHIVQWLPDTPEARAKGMVGVVTEVHEVSPHEVRTFDGGAGRAPMNVPLAARIAGVGLTAAGAAALGLGAVWIHERATGDHPDGIDDAFNHQMNGLVGGGAAAVGLGLGAITLSMAF